MKKLIIIILAFCTGVIIVVTIFFEYFRDTAQSFLIKSNQKGYESSQITRTQQTQDWLLFAPNNSSFSIQYPADMIPESNGSNSIRFRKNINPFDMHQGNFIYLSQVPYENPVLADSIFNYNSDEQILMDRLTVGQKVSVNDGDVTNKTVERGNDIKLGRDDANTYIIQNPENFPDKTVEYRYTVKTDKYLYLLGGYVSDDELSSTKLNDATVKSIMQTFRLRENDTGDK